MKIDTSKPLAENVYNTLLGLLSRRRNEKEWERQLLAQAGRELERDDPACTAERARIGVVYETRVTECVAEGVRSDKTVTLPVGTKLLYSWRGWRYRPEGQPSWYNETVTIPVNQRIQASEDLDL